MEGCVLNQTNKNVEIIQWMKYKAKIYHNSTKVRMMEQVFN